jgi:hypothetical protein
VPGSAEYTAIGAQLADARRRLQFATEKMANLTWARNADHSLANAEAVARRLEVAVEAAGAVATQAQIRRSVLAELQKMAEDLANGVPIR